MYPYNEQNLGRVSDDVLKKVLYSVRPEHARASEARPGPGSLLSKWPFHSLSKRRTLSTNPVHIIITMDSLLWSSSLFDALEMETSDDDTSEAKKRGDDLATRPPPLAFVTFENHPPPLKSMDDDDSSDDDDDTFASDVPDVTTNKMWTKDQSDVHHFGRLS